MTELIIKVDDDFLREAKLKGMEEQFELVRCKDCKYWKHTNGSFGRCSYEYWDENERFRTYIERFCDDFCSDGERKDGDSE